MYFSIVQREKPITKCKTKYNNVMSINKVSGEKVDASVESTAKYSQSDVRSSDQVIYFTTLLLFPQYSQNLASFVG